MVNINQFTCKQQVLLTLIHIGSSLKFVSDDLKKEKHKEYNIKKNKKHYFPQHQYKSSKKAVWCY
jgi:hypothetical protein